MASVLFMGDSITDAGRDRANDTSLGQGYPLMIAGELLYREPSKRYTFVNKGVSGNRVVDLMARWKIDCLNLKPDILSIMIGINDVWHEFNRQNGVEAVKFEKIYAMLLEEAREKLPQTRIILCEPFVLSASATENNFPDWQREVVLRREAVERLAQRFGCTRVKLQERFDSACEAAPAQYWLRDGVHPTPAGHMLITREWLAAL